MTSSPPTTRTRSSLFMSTSRSVDLGGLEPPASSLSGKRSNRLSYRSGPVLTSGGRGYPMTGKAPNSALWTRLVVLHQGQLETARKRHGGVVDEGEDRGDTGHDDGLEHAGEH